MKVKQIFTLLTLSLAIISSCSTKDNFNIDLNTKYTIAEKETIKDKIIFRVTVPYNADGLFPTTVESVKWGFDGLPLLFNSNCTMTRDELGSFAKDHNLSTSFSKDKSYCDGTSFSTYTSIIDKNYADVTLTPNKGLTGIYALCYVASLTEYTVICKETSDTFSLYATIENPYLSFLRID